MATTTTITTVYDGKWATIIQFTGISTSGGDENLETKVNVSLLQPVPKTVKVMDVSYEISGGIVRLFWDADDPVEFLSLASSATAPFNYETNRGLINGGGPSATGNILLSTVGFDSGSSYSIKMELRKKY